MNPKVFGLEHIIFLIIAVILMATAITLIKIYCKSDKALKIAVKVSSAILLVAIIWNRLAITFSRANIDFTNLIPDTFCGVTSLVFALIGLFAKKDSKLFQFGVFCALLGGTLTLINPDFIGQSSSIFYQKTISGLLHHALALYLGLLVLITGYCKLKLKNWFVLPLGLTCYMTYGIFLVTALSKYFSNAMDIYKPLISGTIFTWWFVGILFLALYTITLFIIEYVTRRKAKKQTQKDAQN